MTDSFIHTMNKMTKEKIDETEKLIKSIQTKVDNFSIQSKDIKDYKKICKQLELGIINTDDHIPGNSFNDSKQAASDLAHYKLTVEMNLLKSRIYEVKAMIALAEEEPVKAREFINLAYDKLPKTDNKYTLISHLGWSQKENKRQKKESRADLFGWFFWITIIAIWVYLVG